MSLSKISASNSLRRGNIGIIPTDTIYGLAGQALKRQTVERIYKVRKRSPDKPLIILISSIDDLKLFGIRPDHKTLQILDKYWPGQVSIILPCAYKKFTYLHRGTNSLAFRFPAKTGLLEILDQTGPLVAPSANPEGSEPAENIAAAREYFGDRIDFYYGSGRLQSPPSTLIRIEKGKVEVLREGAVKI